MSPSLYATSSSSLSSFILISCCDWWNSQCRAYVCSLLRSMQGLKCQLPVNPLAPSACRHLCLGTSEGMSPKKIVGLLFKFGVFHIKPTKFSSQTPNDTEQNFVFWAVLWVRGNYGPPLYPSFLWAPWLIPVTISVDHGGPVSPSSNFGVRGMLMQIVSRRFCHVSEFQAPDCLHYNAVECAAIS